MIIKIKTMSTWQYLLFKDTIIWFEKIRQNFDHFGLFCFEKKFKCPMVDIKDFN